LPPPSPPAAATCLCRDAWESAGVHYQGCAESPLGNWCVVKDMCNGAHSTGDGTSWVQCTDDNVAPPPPPGVPPPPPPPPPPPRAVGLPGIDGKEVASPIVTQVSTADAGEGVAGHTTYRLSLLLNPAQTTNIYTIFGEEGSQLSVPPAYQVATPFGVDIGGTYPQFWAAMADSKFDSWLTVGITEGNADNQLSSIGISFGAWTAEQGIECDDGAVFYMDPSTGPSGSVVVAQLTVPDGTQFTVTMGAQGRGMSVGDDWQDDDNVFRNSGGGGPPPGGGH